MELFFRKIGKNKPTLIVLHGLYGSSDNWMNLARYWSKYYEVYLVDLRNHGRSPHSKTHSYKAMRDDILSLMDNQKIQKAIVLGHSMGGKLAMRLAMDYPERINALIVVDIAPKNYISENNKQLQKHRNILKAMQKLKLEQFQRREEIDSFLSKLIPEERVRQFIMKNIKRNKDFSFSWKLNLPVIQSEIENITQGFSEHEIKKNVSGFPVLFIKGEQSDYILENDKAIIESIFPSSEMQTIPNAGHWVHAEQSEQLSKLVLNFLEG